MGGTNRFVPPDHSELFLKKIGACYHSGLNRENGAIPLWSRRCDSALPEIVGREPVWQ